MVGHDVGKSVHVTGEIHELVMVALPDEHLSLAEPMGETIVVDVGVAYHHRVYVAGSQAQISEAGTEFVPHMRAVDAGVQESHTVALQAHRRWWVAS